MCCQIPTAPNIFHMQVPKRKEKREGEKKRKEKQKVKYERWFVEPRKKSSTGEVNVKHTENVK